MAGILDSKNRIMDVAITEEGRRQLTTGKMKIEFVSFTDRHTYYQASAFSGSEDTRDRLFLEATSLPQDSITFEADSSGNFLSFASGPLELDAGGHIYHTSGSTRLSEVTSSAVFASLTSSLLAQSTNNFKNQFLIGSYALELSSSFTASPSEGFVKRLENDQSFIIDDTGPIPSPSSPTLTSLNPLAWDARTTFTRNKSFLPPLYEDSNGNPRYFGGTDPSQNPSSHPDAGVFNEPYHNIEGRTGFSNLTGDTHLKEFSDLLPYMFTSGKEGIGVTENENGTTSFVLADFAEKPMYPFRSVKFNSTTEAMNLVIQMFETPKDAAKIKKLEFIDTGYWTRTNPSTGAPTGDPVKVVFAGKVRIDRYGMPCFINIFTLIFHNVELVIGNDEGQTTPWPITTPDAFQAGFITGFSTEGAPVHEASFAGLTRSTQGATNPILTIPKES
jgi:hypothetical protein